MLCALISVIFLLKNMALKDAQACNHTCSMKALQEDSLQKIEIFQNDPNFQKIVENLQKPMSTLQSNSPLPHSSFPRRREPRKMLGKDGILSDKKQACTTETNLEKKCTISRNAWVPEFPASARTGMTAEGDISPSNLYIFTSFSMSEKALLNLARDAKQFGATLVLRGFHQGSYVKTTQALQNVFTKTGQGVLIDPELYTLFNITAVPTFVWAKPFPLQSQERIQTPIHDKLQGHVSTHYALEMFAKEGDLRQETRLLLERKLIP